MATWTELEIAP